MRRESKAPFQRSSIRTQLGVDKHEGSPPRCQRLPADRKDRLPIDSLLSGHGLSVQ